MKLRAWLAVALFACTSADPGAVLDVETDSPAVEDGRTVQTIGLETTGGAFTPLLESGCATPCEKTFHFSTAVDGQTEIAVSLRRRATEEGSASHALGEFVVTGIPAKPRGRAQVALTLVATDDAIRLRAEDLSGADVRLARRAR